VIIARNGDEGSVDGDQGDERVVRGGVEKIPVLDAPLFIRGDDACRKVWNAGAQRCEVESASLESIEGNGIRDVEGTTPRTPKR
jgi:hypothetical protein